MFSAYARLCIPTDTPVLFHDDLEIRIRRRASVMFSAVSQYSPIILTDTNVGYNVTTQ
uniref:Uncharacterized protein n=1 Tax=Anguilla anguilla TaxID=7936 RepID=A0A0E9PQB2_ANGAN